jgi:hypothetical protein
MCHERVLPRSGLYQTKAMPESCLCHASVLPRTACGKQKPCLSHARVVTRSCLSHARVYPDSCLCHARVLSRLHLSHTCVMQQPCLCHARVLAEPESCKRLTWLTKTRIMQEACLCHIRVILVSCKIHVPVSCKYHEWDNARVMPKFFPASVSCKKTLISLLVFFNPLAKNCLCSTFS